MLAAWVRGLRGRGSFSIRFAVLLGVLGVVIAGVTAAIPIQLAASDARSQALDRAADKGGIAVNLIAQQRAALHTYVSGVAGQLDGPLSSGDTATATQIITRQSGLSDSQDILGGSFGVAFRGGRPLDSVDADVTTVLVAVAHGQRLAVAAGGTPWLVEQAPVGTANGVAYIARPMQSQFVNTLAADLGGGADAAFLAVVHGDTFVSGTTTAGAVQRGSRVPSAYAPAAQLPDGAVLASLDGHDVAASVRPLGDGISLLVTTTVGPTSGLFSSVVGPIAGIAVMMILVALIVVFAIVQRYLQRPLRRLDRAVAALQREDFDVPVPPGNDDELGRLARSFESMRVALRASLSAAEARAAIATELNQSQPLQTALQRVCGALRRTTGAGVALIAVEHSDMADAFAVSDGIGIPTAVDVARLLRGSGPLGAALTLPTATPLQADALDSSEEAHLGLRHICASPLRIGSHVLGALAIADKPDGVNPADIALVAAAAEMVALALERYRILAIAQRQASTDELTGLYNYRFLVDYLDQQIALAERLDSPLAVLMLDLDRFKTLNDSHGHHAGDEALRRFAATLRETIRRSDLAARYGGEEFVVVMANTNREEARLVAEKIRRAVAGLVIAFDDASLHITVSIGGVAYPDDTGDAQQLLQLADDGLYQAKRGGRNRVCFVSDDGRRRTLARAAARGTARIEAEDERDTGRRSAQ